MLLTLAAGVAGCTSSDPRPAETGPEPSEQAQPWSIPEDLCARIDFTVAAPVFGEQSPEQPTEDRIGSSHQCVQMFHGQPVDGGWDGPGVVKVRVLGFDTPEAARQAYDAFAAGPTTPPPAEVELPADAVRQVSVGGSTTIAMLDGRRAVEVELSPMEELGDRAEELPTVTAKLASQVLTVLRSAE